MTVTMQQFFSTLRHVRLRSIAFTLAGLLLTAGIAAFVGYRVHTMEKEILRLRGELNTQAATMEYNRYLLTRANIVTMVANTVEDYLNSGETGAVIEKYLTESTDNIINTLDPTTTGLYGWFREEYLDGSGWVPEEDYVPTERPWYLQTMNSGKEITLVDPYLDAQTHTIMMTVSKLLPDGRSVLAMDISLNPIQEILEQVAAATEGGQALLLNEAGVVVAHSDETQLGRNYLEEPDSVGGIVARKLFDEGLTQFDVDTPEGKYTVYIDSLEGGWYSVSLINADIWHRPLHRAMAIFYSILTLVVLAIISVFMSLTAKNIALQELHTRVDREEKRGEELQALSETDRMTGLNDRVSGERKVNALLSSGAEGMFLELDIDRFKSINDTYGHQTGDEVILAVAEALRTAFRTNDVTMRLGGDEFGVFAVGIDNREMGEAIVRRLFEHTEKVDIRGIKVSVSVGAAFRGRSFHDLYGAADDALYISKKTPGNSLTFAPEKARSGEI